LRTESLVADPFSSLLNVGAHLMPADRSLDIDYEYQLVQAFDSNTDR
jgi:hypothetical protein